MSAGFDAWFDDLRLRRRRWVDASRENGFDRGIWNATVEKYADPTHFVFELLQNAEDAGATRATFRLEREAISFEHDGKAFDRDDIEGVTGIGNTTKIEEANKIGCFGIGFKSVYVVTGSPEVHCPIEGRRRGFAIRDLVVPELIATDQEGGGTVVRLPIPGDDAEDLLEGVGSTLDARGPRSLLFLDSLRELRWVDGSGEVVCSVDDAKGLRTIRVAGARGSSNRRFMILSRSVTRESDGSDYAVKAALVVNDGGEVVPEPSPTPLAVYFDTEDTTGLHFQVHGPFQLTDNRANAKREDPWNQLLVRELGVLLTEGLERLREEGLLRRSVLELLPNASDELPETWAPIRDAVVDAFRASPLLPTTGGGHVRSGDGVRGTAEVREALGDDGLIALAGAENARWAQGGLRGSRTEAFLATVGVREFGLVEALAAFRRAMQPYAGGAEKARVESWLDALPDDRLQRFYLLLDQATRQKRPGFDAFRFVRLEDERRARPSDARLPPAGSRPDEDLGQLGARLVRSGLIRGGRTRGQEVEQFLRRAGVPEVGEGDWVGAILKESYGPDARAPSAERHLQHVRRFVRYFEDTADAEPFDVAWLRVEGRDGFFKPSNVFLDAPYSKGDLARIYDGRVPGRSRLPLWSGYARLKRRKEFLELLDDAGVEPELEIVRASVGQNSRRSELYAGFAGSRVTDTCISEDWDIPQLGHMLALKDHAISRIVWRVLCEAGQQVMWARYAPNQTRTANRCLSQLAQRLRDAEWIPAADGSMLRPAAAAAETLAPDLALQPAQGWLETLGFGHDHRQRSEQHKARRRAAESIGLPPELADRLGAMSEDARTALGAEMIRRIAEGSFARPEFPERNSPNPERRAVRVGERALAAPEKSFEVKERSVRTSGGDAREIGRVYLMDLYTNGAGQMVCQACRDQMPFLLPDGSPYFEAVALLSELSVELSENRLALCPTCAAKWRHARETGESEVMAAIASSHTDAIDVVLAGETASIKFVEMHFEDIRAALAALRTGGTVA